MLAIKCLRRKREKMVQFFSFFFLVDGKNWGDAARAGSRVGAARYPLAVLSSASSVAFCLYFWVRFSLEQKEEGGGRSAAGQQDPARAPSLSEEPGWSSRVGAPPTPRSQDAAIPGSSSSLERKAGRCCPPTPQPAPRRVWVLWKMGGLRVHPRKGASNAEPLTSCQRPGERGEVVGTPGATPRPLQRCRC